MERLRVGLLVGAGLLVVVIAGFLEFAHYKAHRILADLPKRLGATITREFDNYSYSQSYKGKTVFTIHAGKGVEHKDGKMALHDVDLMMYGRKGDRKDHISGAEFEYDEKAQVVKALGLVHLDLEAPPAEEAAALGAKPEKAAGGAAASGQAGGVAKQGASGDGPGSTHDHAPDKVIHITTSGLVYTQKEGIATTDQEIEFTFGGLTGKAIGAVYNSETGYVVLGRAVTVHGVEHGQPVELTATHAEFDRQTELARLEHARYSSNGETAEAEVGLIHMRADGSAERIEGERAVRLMREGEGTVTADRGDLRLDGASRPTGAVLTGTVRYAEEEPLRTGQGKAEVATLRFDAQGRVEHVELKGAEHGGSGLVESTERARRTEAEKVWSVRELSAETVELALSADAAGRAELKEATAVGSAALHTYEEGGGMESTQLKGDRLEARFVEARSGGAHGQTEVSTVHGVGHAALEQVGAKGIEQTSQGDVLTVNFREARGSTGSGGGGAKRAGTVEVATAVEEGHVEMTRTVPAALAAAGSKPTSGPEVQHARAERASFDQDTNRMTLAGAAEMWDRTSRLWADRVQMEQGSGDAVAEGAVRVTYGEEGGQGTGGQGGGGQPTHVLAERAELQHAAGRATFYGAASGGGAGTGLKLARLWQSGAAGEGGSQVEAPVLVFEQGASRPGAPGTRRLLAHGLGAGAPMAVRTVLVSSAHAGKTAKGGRGAGAGLPGTGNGEGQVIRVTSREMVYDDGLRQVDFRGGVRVLDADGDLRSQQATVYLKASGAKAGGVQAKASAPTDGLMAGGVERIVATGQIEMTQPGRRASGERLVYTAEDGMFVLTGTAAAPPKVVDAQQGTATGASLRFHSGDDSVVIAGGEEGSGGQKARTETKVKQ